MFSVLAVGTQTKIFTVNRVLAKCVDLGVFFAIAILLPYPLGPLLGFLYSLLADGICFRAFRGQSIGKRLMNLRVISELTKKPATWKDSVLRNAPVGVATFFAIIPVWGWLILALIGLPLVIVEIYLMLRAESGRRIGDAMADTEVIELKNC